MDTRTEMLKAAEAQLLESPERDIATRAVCEAVGVGAPVLYRLFGDKNGLLTAVVDRTFERYLASKRAQKLSDDPVEDLHSAWDLHITFALKNQAVYRIAYAPALDKVPAGVEEARQLLVARLVRCAEVGRLNTTPDEAAQVMMTACTGLAISLISQPETYKCPRLSQRVRDAVLKEILVDAPANSDRQNSNLDSAALQMAALIRAHPTPLTGPESALMLQWLDSISSASNNESSTSSPKRRQQPSPSRRRR
jgi:AcrR family transcriptional regulator